MKVISNGKEKVYTRTCSECHSDLEYTEDDVFYTKEERRGGVCKTVPHLFKKDEYYTNVYLQEYRCIKCPVCGNINKSLSFRGGLPSLKTIGWVKTR